MAQIATTIEQCEKLLNLGISIETADMHYWFDANYNEWEIEPNKAPDSLEKLPAWSLGALIELMPEEIVDEKFSITYHLTIGKDYVGYSNRMSEEEYEYIAGGDLFSCCIEIIKMLINGKIINTK